MKIDHHTGEEYGNAIRNLLPPGAAWDWPDGGLGMAMLDGLGQEFARLDSAVSVALDNAIQAHRPQYHSWHISEYRRIASEVVAGVVETMPRRMFAVGSHAGDRLWSKDGPATTFPVPLIQVDHLLGPLVVGGHVGQWCGTERSRYILRVRYYRSVVDYDKLWNTLMAFKQAHVFLIFEDITGQGGYLDHAQN